MAEDRKKQLAEKAGATAQGSARAGGGARDPASSRLVRVGSALGNDALQQQLQRANGRRDAILAFICQRLGAVHEAQQRELAQTNIRAREDWDRRVTDNHYDGFTKPDPRRWHAAARLYDQAARALCSGRLSRGAELAELAWKAEQDAFSRTSTLIDTSDLENPTTAAPGREGLSSGDSCAPCDLPAAIDLAHSIQNVVDEIAYPSTWPRIDDPWWTEAEEDEEEKPDGAGGP